MRVCSVIFYECVYVQYLYERVLSVRPHVPLGAPFLVRLDVLFFGPSSRPALLFRPHVPFLDTLLVRHVVLVYVPSDRPVRSFFWAAFF